MTIFDIIRYPISDPPTTDEFEALPIDLLTKWASTCGWNFKPPPSTVSCFYANPALCRSHLNDLNLLRKMISEYNDNI